MSRARAAEGGWLFVGGRVLDAPRAARAGRGGARGTRPAARSGGEAVLVRGERIEAVGPRSSLERMAGRRVRRVNLRGGTLTPGFVDSHIHLLTWIRALGEGRLEEQTPEGLGAAVRRALRGARAGDWITVRGWVPREWPRELKRRSTLDGILSDRPLILYAVDGHSVWANGAALQMAGIGARTANPPGGVVEREPGGEPTGVLAEEAADLLRPLVPRARDAADDLARAIRTALSLGITSAHDFDRSEIWKAAQSLHARSGLPFRLLLSIPAAKLESAESLEIRTGFGDRRLRVGPVKLFADGTLGSATALLEEPYEGSESRGIEVTAPEALTDRCARARAAGLGVAIHAIGDRAVRNALDAIEAATAGGRRFPIPPRIEHIQLAREEDLTRFKRLGALASVQPAHLLTDREVARRHWGARTVRSYAWKSLARAGARLLFGSDAPFDRPGPLLALEAALLRRRAGEADRAAFHPEQRLTLAQSLRAHVEEPHRAAGWGIPLGRIQPGWGADLVAFDQDLLEMGPGALAHAQVAGVWVGGAAAHGKLL
ncbi:MAG: amidohydrolase [Candidatus Latescibacteria bacterium]|nr:amidohydrolase [Candidatus Latescibacterota bacterium]